LLNPVQGRGEDFVPLLLGVDIEKKGTREPALDAREQHLSPRYKAQECLFSAKEEF
jgi:hypothetical protein